MTCWALIYGGPVSGTVILKCSFSWVELMRRVRRAENRGAALHLKSPLLPLIGAGVFFLVQANPHHIRPDPYRIPVGSMRLVAAAM